MNKEGKILRIDPALAIPGAEVTIDCEGLDSSDPTLCAVFFGEQRAPIVALSPKRILAIVPELKQGDVIDVRIESSGRRSEAAGVTVAKRLAEDLHPVANPAFDPDDGSLFTTRSGARRSEERRVGKECRSRWSPY